MKKILYILSGNISTTPRALQSIQSAILIHKVELVYVNRSNTWKSIDIELLKEIGIKGHSVSLGREEFSRWLMVSILHKFASFLVKLFPKSFCLNAIASNKASLFLLFALSKINGEYDLVIGHSYGSLFPAFNFAKRNKLPFIFDIEDYHPGEKSSKREKKRRAVLMQKLLPKAEYLTYASPLIGKYSLDLSKDKRISGISILRQAQQPQAQSPKLNAPDRSVLINNSFPQKEFQFKENKQQKIQFVWFSQNIAAGRGLELIIPALAEFKNEIQLTLIGNLYPGFEQTFLATYSEFIAYVKPLPQTELNLFLSNFDIGLAIELSSSDFNRDICLTNKIFAYAQSGLYIMATNTSAQKQFMEEHQNLGIITGQTTSEMGEMIASIIKNKEVIRQEKKRRFEYAKKLAWEHEGEKLLKVWDEVIGKDSLRS